jgi:hypothetical protein
MSAKQRIECFQQNLGSFLTEQKEYLANRKVGKRSRKNRIGIYVDWADGRKDLIFDMGSHSKQISEAFGVPKEMFGKEVNNESK